MSNSRRRFLSMMVFGLATALSPELLLTRPAWTATVNGPCKVMVTGGDKRLAVSQGPAWTSTSADTNSETNQTIIIDGAKKYQTVLGFGGAFTDAACYTINLLPADKQTSLLKEMFGRGENQLDLNVCRTCIGSSDYSSKAYSFDDGDADPEMKRFSIDHDKQYILPVLRQARAINPDLFLFSSPWSPPGWMKLNNSMLGGTMRRRYMSSYADYFVKFLKGYEAEGVPVQAVTVQNEVDTDQDGAMPACSWPQEYEADFVRQNLGPAIVKSGLKTKIWLIDHNYNLWGRALGELETEDVRKYASGIAWHGYVGDVSKVSDVHKAFPDVDMFWTEGGPEYTDKHYGDNWSAWGKQFSGILRNWCRSITAWNVALDENGKPNIGPFSCGGLVTINSKTGAISYSGQYYAMAHFSKFVKRGAVRVDSQTHGDSDLSHVAFQNNDGRMALIVTNGGAARTVNVQFGNQTMALALDQDSITTIAW